MAEKKISADSKILEVTHQELKDIIKRKAKEEGWNEKEGEDFVSSLLKVYIFKVTCVGPGATN